MRKEYTFSELRTDFVKIVPDSATPKNQWKYIHKQQSNFHHLILTNPWDISTLICLDTVIQIVGRKPWRDLHLCQNGYKRQNAKKCKKKGHLSFNWSPKYDNKPIKNKNENRYNKLNNRESSNLCEFAWMTSHYNPKCWTCASISRSHQRKPKSHVQNVCVNKNKSNFPCVTKKHPQHVSNMIYSFKYHRIEIEKLCNTKSKAPSYKFNKLIRYFRKKDPCFSTYKKSIIGFFMKNFNRMN